MLAVGLLIWKIPYGWGAYDEPFYLTLPYRYLLGDGLISDEWNLTQLSGSLLIVPLWIYDLLGDVSEGVLLSFRIIYVICQILVSMILAGILSSRYRAGKWAALVYSLFIPLNIMALSYDSMGLAFMMLLGAVLSCSDLQKKRNGIISGILFSLAVICNPYLALVYIAYIFSVIILSLRKKKSVFFSAGMLFNTLIGVGVTSLAFCIILFSRTSLSDLIRSLPYLLNDPTHGFKTAYDLFVIPFVRIYQVYFPWVLIWLAVFAAMIVDKNRKKHWKIYFFINLFSVIFCLAAFSFKVITNCFMLPFSVLGLTAYVLSEKKEKKIFYFMWILGIIYGILLHVASDQDVYVIAMALTISDVASVILCSEFLEEKKDDLNIGKYTGLIFCVIVMAQLFTETVSMSRNTYWESTRTETLNTVYTKGPLKGLKTTADKVESYDLMLEDIEEYRQKRLEGGKDRIAFMTLNTWEYLYAGLPYGTYSSWIGYADKNTLDKFEVWCDLHPDKIPSYIYFSKLENKKWDERLINDMAKDMGYTVVESDISYKLEKR